MSVDVLGTNKTVYNGYEDRIVSTPKREGYTMSHSNRSRIAEYFKRAIKPRPGLAAIKKELPPTYCLRGNFCLGRSAHIHTTWADGNSDEHHESTYVRYDLLLMLNRREVDTVWYSRVMSIMAVDLPGDCNVYGKCTDKTHLLAVVQPCNMGQKDA
ncbi:hypothetical protein FA13DRAFT_1800094 [Coprinellus micaceus]|uniref:Uncharacterized protein n=1 Tax=Coprinellus micaceus TaxID=71717 RepID=A0A4Y7SHD5_COPMI|nr:hypothetical protein FA13DRAFT_1800094 [Coprinellus micaceus]